MISLQFDKKKKRIFLEHANTDVTALTEQVRQIEWRKWEVLPARFSFPPHVFRELTERLKTLSDPEKWWSEEVNALVTERESKIAELTAIQERYDFPPFDFEKRFPVKPPRTVPGYAPFQRQAIYHALAAKTSGIFSDPGMGKTLMVGGIHKVLEREGKANRSLIITLSSAKRQFVQELISIFGLNARSVAGDKKQREAIYAGDQYITVTSYPLLSYDAAFVEKQHKIRPYQIITLDEGQRIKDWNGTWAKLARKLRTNIPYRYVTTASALENRLEEMMSLMLWMGVDILGDKADIEEMFCLKDIYGMVSGYQRLDEFRKLTKPFYVRHTREEHMKDLPYVEPEPRWVPLTKDHKAFYKKVVTRTLVDLKDTSRQSKINTSDPFAMYSYLRQALESTELIDPTTAFASKLDELKILLKKEIPVGDKCIIYTPSEKMTQVLARELSEYNPIRFHGGLTTVCKRKTEFCDTGCKYFESECHARDRYKVKFDTDPNCRLFITDDAGKEALNIQSANIVICFGLPWNPEALKQLLGRALRWGQAKTVRFILLLLSGTLDEYIYETVLMKTELFNLIFGKKEGEEENETKVFNFDEIRVLVRERLEAERVSLSADISDR